jgi:dehydrogenase/reductase SDR family member 12
MSYEQFATASQFYLYGKTNCTRNGYYAAKATQDSDILFSDELNLNGKVFIITGGSSGLGFEVLSYLACREATIYMLCRDVVKGREACRRIKDSPVHNIHVISCDCSLGLDIENAWTEIVRAQTSGGGAMRLDGVLCNAGALTHDITITSEGYETTIATHLIFGTYLLVSIAMNSLLSTPLSRVVVVSSGGMYYTKFPEWDVALSRKYSKGGRSYDGQEVYAYSKRGQVLLCEQWAKMYPSVTFVSCHPGWVDTAGLRAAYGDNVSLFEPLRSPSEGAEGITYLLVAPSAHLQSGGFYLDRTPRVKHMAGPFFTEGSYTKNSEEEVAEMMRGLYASCVGMLGRSSELSKHVDEVGGRTSKESTSNLTESECAKLDETGPCDTASVSVVGAEALKRSAPLEALRIPIDIEQFMGRWYVHANIPTFFDKGTVNNVEEYEWDDVARCVKVLFCYSSLSASGVLKEDSTLRQIGTIDNVYRTQWTMSMKFLLYWPLGIKYLILAVDGIANHTTTSARTSPSDPDRDVFAYESCMIGVPDRRFLWIMTRTPSPMGEALYRQYVGLAEAMGYEDIETRINRVAVYQRDAYGNVLQADVESAEKGRRASVKYLEGGHDI